MTADIRIAIVINPELALGVIANTAAAIGIGLGARMPELGAARLTDATGLAIDTSSNRPVPILQADAAAMARLLERASAGAEGAFVVFPAFARALHDYREYEALFPGRKLSDEAIDGIGLCGPAKWVKSLTGSLKLLR